MAANNDFPVLDGIAPSWADIIVRVTATGTPLLEVHDIKSINTNTKVDVGVQKAGGRVMKRTAGEESSEASLTLYREGYQKLLRNLMAIAPPRGNERLISLVHFNVEIQHTPPGSVEIFIVRLKGCRILGRGLNGSEGTDPDVVEVPLHPAKIADVIDGVEVVML